MVNTGMVDNGTINIPQLQQPKGGKFGRSFNPDDVSRPLWGELTLDLNCAGGTASYTTQENAFSNGSQSLVPLTRLAESGCNN